MKNKVLKVLAFCTPFVLASCSGGFGGNPVLSSDDGVKEIKEILSANFANKDIFNLSISADEHLDENLGMIIVKYVERDKSYSQTYHSTAGIGLGDPKEVTSFGFDSNKNSVKKIEEIDFSFVPEKFEEAKSIISDLSDEYEGFVLYSFDLDVNKEGALEGDLRLEGTRKGEGSSMQGRNVVTNYYEFDFDLKDDGTIEFDD